MTSRKVPAIRSRIGLAYLLTSYFLFTLSPAANAAEAESKARLSIAFVNETPEGERRSVSILAGITQAIEPYGDSIEFNAVYSQFDADGYIVESNTNWIPQAAAAVESADIVIAGWINDYMWVRDNYPNKTIINLSPAVLSNDADEIAIGQDFPTRVARTAQLARTRKDASGVAWVVLGDFSPTSPQVGIVRTELERAGFATVEMISMPPSADDLVQRVKQLPRQDSVFYLPATVYQNGEGLGAGEVIARLRGSTDAPIYSFWYNLVRLGGVGGYVFYPQQAGAQAIEAAVDYRALGEFKKSYSSSGYLLNERLFVDFGGAIDDIPKNAEILNRVQPGLSGYQISLIYAGAVGIIVILGFGLLFIQRERRQRSKQENLAKQLRLSRDRLELVLKGSRLGLWDWNPQTNDVTFDERWCEMLGYTLTEIEPTVDSWSSRVHPEDIDSCYADITAHIKGEVDFYDNIHRMQHKDGHWIYIRDRGRVVERDSQGVTRFTGSHEDVTEEVLTRRALHESLAKHADTLRKQNSMYGMVAHELRTPVSAIAMFASGKDDDLLQHKLDIANAAQHLLNTIDDMRLLVNPDLDRPIRTEAFNIEGLNRDIVASVESLLASSSMELTVATELTENDLDSCYQSDTYRLRVAVSNIVKNACLHSNGSHIELVSRITQTSDGSYLCWVVSDDGVGISPADAANLFVEGARGSTAAEGSGLGLYITRTWIEEIGGTVIYEPLVKGTQFKVLVPLIKQTTHASEGSNTAVTESPTPDINQFLENLHILTVEDDGMLRLLNIKLLTALGAKVDEASDGSEALKMLKESHNFILTDYFMPNLSGTDLIKQLRKIGFSGPIVGLTAATIGDQQQEMLDAGADRVLPKPLTAQAFKEVVCELIANQRLS